MIFTKLQAQHVSTAMKMLESSNIDWGHLRHEGHHVQRSPNRQITVAHKFGDVAAERYTDQAAFATAYGLL